MYYLGTKAASDAIKFTIRNDKTEPKAQATKEAMMCSLVNKDECVCCGS